MTDITKLLADKKKWTEEVDNRLLALLQTRDKLTTNERELIAKWFGIAEKAGKSHAKADAEIERIDALEGAEEEEEEEEEVDEGEVKAPRRSAKASETEINLVKMKLAIKAAAAEVYDSAALDLFCAKGEIVFGDIAELKKMMVEVAFMGFRWRDVFSKLRKRAKDAGISKEIFIYHMRFFCAIYVERGSAYLWRGLTTLKNKTMKVYIQAMIKVYDVVKQRPAGGYQPDDATITRIVALFPDLVSQVMKEAAKVPIAMETSPEIKNWLKFPGGASLIPKDKAEAYTAWLKWYRAFGKVINKGVEPAEGDVKRFGDAIHQSDVMSDVRRNEVYAWA